MRLAHLSSAALLSWAGAALANGGGYSFGVTFTGSVAPFQASGTEKVRILEETLEVALRRGDAAVVVRYSMKNVTDEPVTVKFGFPVEGNPPDDGELGFDVEESPTERGPILAQAIRQLRGYRVTADGAPVKAAFHLEPFAAGKVKPFPGSRVLEGIAGWMASEVTFPASGTVALEIRYSADHAGSVRYVSDDWTESARVFDYRLSSGAVWNGTIAKGTVTVVADGIPADEVEIVAPRDRFVREGDRWKWSFSDLEPSLADDISILAVPGHSVYGVYGAGAYLELGDAWGERHQRFEAKASSTLPRSKLRDYGPHHLADDSFRAAWSEGAPGNGIGEWVELKPAAPAPLLALEVTPGFAPPDDGRKLFEANGSPTRVEILLNGEHAFVATLGDVPRPQVIPVVGYGKPVSRIRITIREVRPGKKYADTCITRVALYERMAKAPERYGAR